MELQGLLCKNVFINCRSCANPTANSQTGRHENRRGSTAHLAAASWKPTCPSSSSPSPSSVRSYPHSPVAAREQSCRRSPKTAMAESSTPADGVVAEEARQQEAGQGNSEDSHGLQDTKEQEVRKGKTALASTELMREDLVQSAVSFLKHPKVAASSDGQRRSFLENKGLTVDEIDEAFRRLQSPSSDSASLNTCTSQGVSDHSCRITQQETKVGTKCMDGSERVEPGTEPAVPRHPKSYMEIMEMIQRGERPDDIQDINDDPPNPDQPISEPRMAPKPKPWEKQDQGSLAWDLKPPLGDSSIPRAEAQYDGGTSSKPTDSVDASKQDPVAQAEVAVRSKSTTDHTASSLE